MNYEIKMTRRSSGESVQETLTRQRTLEVLTECLGDAGRAQAIVAQKSHSGEYVGGTGIIVVEVKRLNQ